VERSSSRGLAGQLAVGVRALQHLERTVATPPERFDDRCGSDTPPRRLRVNRQMQIGLGWLRWKRPKSGLTIFWHNGGTGGYRSFAAFAPDAGAAVVVLHARARPVDRLGLRVLEVLAAPAVAA
jgi:CubicO group peptidase (beta-lactamase class C family)